MKYSSSTRGLVVTVSLIMLVTLTAFTLEPKAVGHAWPNVTEMTSHSVCMAGTCLEISAFQRRKLYIPQDRLRQDQIERDVLRMKSKATDIDQSIHLFYNQKTASLPHCEHCQPTGVLDMILEMHGQPDQIAIYKRQKFGETLTLIEEDEMISFLDELSIR